MTPVSKMSAYDEEERLRVLHNYGVLDTLPEEDFDDLTALASHIVGAPIAMISLVDRDRQWFKSKVGVDVDQTSRSVSFCAYAIHGESVFEVEDATKDPRFVNNPLVTSAPNIRFYAGMPLKSPGGAKLGTLCTIDRVPRKLDEGQRRALEILGRQVMAQLELRRLLREGEGRDRDRATIQELSSLLHSCISIVEAGRIIGRCVTRLLPQDSGAIYLMNQQQKVLEPLAWWGDSQAAMKSFPREDCWALRRGRSHGSDDSSDCLHCPHLHAFADRATLCVPMIAQGESLGVMTAVWKNANRSESAAEWTNWLVATVADILAVALAGLRWREELRENSIRDPLTGLFNRRYMEETLGRELHRVQRSKLSLGVLMVDLDHFKRLNDTYGHEAGDNVLRTFAHLLHDTFREDDIVCRCGGEEFIVILPTAQAEIVMHRAEQLRQATENLRITYGDQTLPSVTVSAGAAIFPHDGDNGVDLIRAADKALYQAKHAGRNRVMLAAAQLGRASAAEKL